jgi:hypothetical protein
MSNNDAQADEPGSFKNPLPSGHATVDELWRMKAAREVDFAGFLIPWPWIARLRTRRGFHWIAAAVLANVVWWHTAKREPDKDGVFRLKKHFWDDAYQFNRKKEAERLWVTPRAVTQALGFLEKMGVVRRSYRGKHGYRKSLFVDLDLGVLAELCSGGTAALPGEPQITREITLPGEPQITQPGSPLTGESNSTTTTRGASAPRACGAPPGLAPLAGGGGVDLCSLRSPGDDPAHAARSPAPAAPTGSPSSRPARGQKQEGSPSPKGKATASKPAGAGLPAIDWDTPPPEPQPDGEYAGGNADRVQVVRYHVGAQHRKYFGAKPAMAAAEFQERITEARVSLAGWTWGDCLRAIVAGWDYARDPEARRLVPGTIKLQRGWYCIQCRGNLKALFRTNTRDETFLYHVQLELEQAGLGWELGEATLAKTISWLEGGEDDGGEQPVRSDQALQDSLKRANDAAPFHDASGWAIPDPATAGWRDVLDLLKSRGKFYNTKTRKHDDPSQHEPEVTWYAALLERLARPPGEEDEWYAASREKVVKILVREGHLKPPPEPPGAEKAAHPEDADVDLAPVEAALLDPDADAAAHMPPTAKARPQQSGGSAETKPALAPATPRTPASWGASSAT